MGNDPFASPPQKSPLGKTIHGHIRGMGNTELGYEIEIVEMFFINPPPSEQNPLHASAIVIETSLKALSILYVPKTCSKTLGIKVL